MERQGHGWGWWQLTLQADGLSGRSFGGPGAFQALEVLTDQRVICLDGGGEWGRGWLKARAQVRLYLDFAIVFVCIGLSVSEDCSPFWNSPAAILEDGCPFRQLCPHVCLSVLRQLCTLWKQCCSLPCPGCWQALSLVFPLPQGQFEGSE